MGNGLFQKAKDIAKKAAVGVAERFKERYSKQPAYAEKREIVYAARARELKEKANVTEQEARIVKAQRKIALAQARKETRSFGMTNTDPYSHLYGRTNGEDKYLRIFGKKETTMGMMGNKKKAESRDPYGYLFGK
jgi:hypothetical protein